MFANKIMQLTQEALSPADELQKCPIATIKGVLKGYTDRTEKYMPWVYDFWLNRRWNIFRRLPTAAL